MIKYMKTIISLLIVLSINGCTAAVDRAANTRQNDDEINNIDDTIYTKEISETTTNSIETISTQSIDEKWDSSEDYFEINRESIKKPWTEELIKQAWETTEESEKWTDYLDCIFIDINNDGIDELILTVPTHLWNRGIKSFRLLNDEIIEVEWSSIPIGVKSGTVLNPPTSQEIFEKTIYENSLVFDFKIVSINEKFYMSVIDFCSYPESEIKNYRAHIYEINFDGKKLNTNELYQWGIYTWVDKTLNEDFIYNKCVGYDDENFPLFEPVEKEEIQKFLDMMYYEG